MPEQCVVQFADMIRFGRDLDALSSLGANFQDAFSSVNGANKCSQLPEVIRLLFLFTSTCRCESRVASIRGARLR